MKTNKVTTRIMTNKERNSFRVDVLTYTGNSCIADVTSHYYKTEKEAISYQKFITNLNKYKEFI
jgi:hypothetical protein